MIVAFGSYVEGHSLAYLNIWQVFFLQCRRPRMLYRIRRLPSTGTPRHRCDVEEKGKKEILFTSTRNFWNQIRKSRKHPSGGQPPVAIRTMYRSNNSNNCWGF